jgi:hypothetical protein
MSAPRKLAAILAADVAGYSRLTGLDEEGTQSFGHGDRSTGLVRKSPLAPSRDSGADRSRGNWSADRFPDSRPLSQGPHDDHLCQAHQAGVRRLCAASGLCRLRPSHCTNRISLHLALRGTSRHGTSANAHVGPGSSANCRLMHRSKKHCYSITHRRARADPARAPTCCDPGGGCPGLYSQLTAFGSLGSC